MIDPLLQDIVAWALALLFAGAALGKAMDPGAFRTALEDYRLVPPPLLAPAVFMIVALEAATVFLLIWPGLRYTGALLGGALLFAYAMAMLINLLKGRVHIDCGCLGRRGHALSYWLVLRNLSLVTFAGILFLPAATRSPGWLDFVTLGAAIPALAALYAGVNQLIANASAIATWRSAV